MERDWFAVGWKMLVVRGVIGMVFGMMWGAVFVLGGLAARRELNRSETSSASLGPQ